jgi:hypothetical protein
MVRTKEYSDDFVNLQTFKDLKHCFKFTSEKVNYLKLVYFHCARISQYNDQVIGWMNKEPGFTFW